MPGELLQNNQSESEQSEPIQDYPDFDPENAQKLSDEYNESKLESEKPTPEFEVNPNDYSEIFAKQAEFRFNPITKSWSQETLNINETLGRMVSCTAETIAAITGDEIGKKPADHVIYLDKSARPVSWLVDEFWDDFADTKQPSKSLLAIDRRPWFRDYCGLDFDENGYITGVDGKKHRAEPDDFDANFDKISRETLARIRSLYIAGGIEDEDVEKIFATPTVLDGKNLLIVDEVANSGSTLHIAKRLLKAAIPELNSVEGHIFWRPKGTHEVGEDMQMGGAPAWYPKESKDWRGRGVKDFNPEYYEQLFKNNPSNENRARRFGSIVLGEPLLDLSEEGPEQPSQNLIDEIRQMHADYEAGHILPNIPSVDTPQTRRKVMDRLKEEGVEFIPLKQAKNNPRAYFNLVQKRDKLP